MKRLSKQESTEISRAISEAMQALEKLKPQAGLALCKVELATLAKPRVNFSARAGEVYDTLRTANNLLMSAATADKSEKLTAEQSSTRKLIRDAAICVVNALQYVAPAEGKAAAA